jgi:multidrug efflux pump subunit AcrB
MDGQRETVNDAVEMAVQQIKSVSQAMTGVFGGSTQQRTLSKDRQVSIYLQMSPEQRQRLQEKVGPDEYARYEQRMKQLQVEGY